MAEERVRYGDADLAEFKQIILKKLILRMVLLK